MALKLCRSCHIMLLGRICQNCGEDHGDEVNPNRVTTPRVAPKPSSESAEKKPEEK